LAVGANLVVSEELPSKIPVLSIRIVSHAG
jgi:hypothetical protein